MKVVTYEPECVRPDLPVPLSPLRGLLEAVRRYLLGLRGPEFSRARLVSAVWAVVTGAVGLVSLLVPSVWRAPVVACAALLGVYLLVRTFALMVLERRQHAFERQWLIAQSEVLRGHTFDIVRFAVRDPSGGRAGRRAYDLDRSSDLRDLLLRWDRERASGASSRVTVEFAYWSGAGGPLAVGEVNRDLSELTFLQGRAGPARAWIRFPEARYLGRPAYGRHPAQQAFWVLSGPVVVSVGQAAYGDAGGPAETPELGSAR